MGNDGFFEEVIWKLRTEGWSRSLPRQGESIRGSHMCSKSSDMRKPLKKAKGITVCGMRPTKHVLKATVRSMIFC